MGRIKNAAEQIRLRIGDAAVRGALAVVLAAGLLPVPYGAAQADEARVADAEGVATEAYDVVGSVDTGWSELPDSDELAEGYVESVLYGDDSAVDPLANYGATVLEGESLRLYSELKAFIQDVAANGGSTVFTFEWNYTGTGDSAQEVYNQAYAELRVSDVRRLLLADCPYDFYWFDKTTGVSSRGSGVTSDDGTTWSIATLTLVFTPSGDYQGSEDYTVDATKAKATATAAQNAASVVEQYSQVTDVQEKLTAYKDAICGMVSYNEDAAAGGVSYGDPWQLVYVFDGDDSTEVVCEGYSKAFQYLCDLTWPDNDPVTCYTVTGTMGSASGAGGHMWNLIAVEADGTTYGSYLADVTNSDAGTIGQNGELFLASALDASSSTAEGYVIPLYSGITYAYYDETIALYESDIRTLASAAFPQVSSGGDSGGTTVAAVAVPATSSLVYNGAEQTGIASTGLYTVEGGSATNAGTYTATLSLKDKDSNVWASTGKADDIKIEWSIEKAQVAKVGFAASLVYNGTEQTVYTADSDAEFTVTGNTGTNAGDYTATFSLKDKANYSWGDSSDDYTVAWSIAKADFARASVLLDTYRYEYDGSAKEPGVTALIDGVQLVVGTDYSVEYRNNVNAGTAIVVAKGMGNYAGEVDVAFTIEAADEPEPTPSFTDVVGGEWYETAVTWAAQAGLITGYSDGSGKFGVGDGLTRAQLAVILWRYADPDAAAAYDDETTAATTNTTGKVDVESGVWYTAAVNWAIANQVMNGYSDGSNGFGPDDEVTFEQLVSVLANFLADEGELAAADASELDTAFADAFTVSIWAVKNMAWGYAKGVYSGYPNTDGTREIRPNENVLRERCAAVLYNLSTSNMLPV